MGALQKLSKIYSSLYEVLVLLITLSTIINSKFFLTSIMGYLEPKTKSILIVRGMVNSRGGQMLVVRTFSDPKLADSLVLMLAFRNTDSAMSLMKLSDKVEYKRLPMVPMLPIPE